MFIDTGTSAEVLGLHDVSPVVMYGDVRASLVDDPPW